jgi:DNA-binding HxlR family transcriptional regulator
MLGKKGAVEMLQLIDSHSSKSFSDFVLIVVNKKRLSSATVAKRIDELLAAGTIEEIIVKSPGGRRVVAYKATVKGKRAIKLAEKLVKENLI